MSAGKRSCPDMISVIVCYLLSDGACLVAGRRAAVSSTRVVPLDGCHPGLAPVLDVRLRLLAPGRG